MPDRWNSEIVCYNNDQISCLAIYKRTIKNIEGEHELENIKDVKAYRIVEEKDLPEVHGKGYVLEHIKTKARVLIIENDDVNKVFNIGFRTPP